MKVSTLIRQLDYLAKNHPNRTVALATLTEWDQAAQVTGVLVEDNEVILFTRRLAGEKLGLQAFDLMRLLNADNTSRNLPVVTKQEEPVIGVTVYYPRLDMRKPSASFINDAGLTATVAEGEAGLNIFSEVKLNVTEFQRFYQYVALEDTIDNLAVYNHLTSLRETILASLGIKP